jgi:hypothetical protein
MWVRGHLSNKPTHNYELQIVCLIFLSSSMSRTELFFFKCLCL